MSEENKLNSESLLTLPYRETNTAIQQKITSGVYKLQKKHGKSKVWNIFNRIVDNNGVLIPNKVCCAHCYSILTYSKRTSSYNLTRHHCFSTNKDLNVRKTITPPEEILPLSTTENSSTSGSYEKPVDVTDKNFSHDKNEIRHNVLTGIYKLRTKFSKCKLWQVLKLIEDSEGNVIPKKACCKICFQVLNFHEHNTSNLVKHKCYIRIKNTISFQNSCKNADDSMEIDSSNNLDSSSNMKNHECLEASGNTEMHEFPTPMKEWQESYIIHELEELPPANEFANSNLKTKIEKIFSKWCIENFRPLELAKDSGLKRFAELMIWIGANYGTKVDINYLLPETTIITKIITSQYEETLKNLKNEIVEHCQNGFGLTSKLWFDNYRQLSYISLTIHYIKNGQLAAKFIGLNTVHNDENINNVIEAKLQQTLNNYNCFYKDSIIVTDESFKTCNFTHISCINHIFHNVINETIKDVTELVNLNSQCLKIKEFFSQSNVNCNLSAIFNSLCLTKWNAFYYLLIAIKRNWQEIECILQENDKPLKLENINRHYIEQVLNVLEPFEHVSKKLEGKEHPTIHLVYACISGLKDSCSAEDSDDCNIRKFKEILSKKLQTAVFSNLSITHKIALFLFPPANKLLQFSEDEKNHIKTKISFLLQPDAQNKYKPPIKKAQSISNNLNSMVSSYLKNFVTPPTYNNSDQISNEIHTYECLNIPFEDNFDILQWWHTRQSQFPLLYKLSCRVLATPATCSSSDLVCSMVKQLAENNTNILSNLEMLNQTIFLNFNSEKSTEFDELCTDVKIENNAIEEI